MHNKREAQRHLLKKNITWKFCKIGTEVLRISWEKFPKNSQQFLETMSLFQFSKKSVKLVTKSWEFLKNFQRSIPEKFSGISLGKIPEKFSEIFRVYVPYSVPQIIQKIGDQVLRISQEFPEKYSWVGKIPGFSGISRTKPQNSDPRKISLIGDQFQRISWEFLWNQSQELVLEKTFGNSSKQVPKTGELGENPHFCYLG